MLDRLMARDWTIAEIELVALAIVGTSLVIEASLQAFRNRADRKLREKLVRQTDMDLAPSMPASERELAE